MEKSKRARRRKPGYSQADLKPPLAVTPEVVHREVEYRAVIDGGATPKMNRSAEGVARSSLHYGGEGVLIHPPHQVFCGPHGGEEQCVTSGGLAESPVGTGDRGAISGERNGVRLGQ